MATTTYPDIRQIFLDALKRATVDLETSDLGLVAELATRLALSDVRQVHDTASPFPRRPAGEGQAPPRPSQRAVSLFRVSSVAGGDVTTQR